MSQQNNQTNWKVIKHPTAQSLLVRAPSIHIQTRIANNSSCPRNNLVLKSRNWPCVSTSSTNVTYSSLWLPPGLTPATHCPLPVEPLNIAALPGVEAEAPPTTNQLIRSVQLQRHNPPLRASTVRYGKLDAPCIHGETSVYEQQPTQPTTSCGPKYLWANFTFMWPSMQPAIGGDPPASKPPPDNDFDSSVPTMSDLKSGRASTGASVIALCNFRNTSWASTVHIIVLELSPFNNSNKRLSYLSITLYKPSIVPS